MRSDVQVQFTPTTRTTGTLIHSLTWAYCSCINSHAGMQTPSTYTKDYSVQCSLLPAPPLSFMSNYSSEQPSSNDEDGDLDSTESDSEAGSDTDYCNTESEYCSDHMERYSCMCVESVTLFMVYILPSYILHLSKKYIMFEESLMYLFKRCQNCGSETYGTTTRVIGMFLSVSQHRSDCSFTFKWAIQPVGKSIPAGNILLSAAILYSGTLPAKVLRMLKIYGCATITSRTFFSHQKSYLQPSVFAVWN